MCRRDARTTIGTWFVGTFPDVLFFGGLGFAGWGLWNVEPRLCGVVVGGLLMLFGLRWAGGAAAGQGKKDA